MRKVVGAICGIGEYLRRIGGWVKRHPARALLVCWVVGLLLTAVAGALYPPADILGIPSVVWAADETTVILPDGSLVRYMPQREEEWLESHTTDPGDHVRELLKEKPEGAETVTDEEVTKTEGILCRVTIVSSRRIGMRILRNWRDSFMWDGKDRYYDSDEARHQLLEVRVEAVNEAGQARSIREGSHIRIVERYFPHFLYEEGSQWVFTLVPVGEFYTEPAYGREDEIRYFSTHAPYILVGEDDWPKKWERLWPIVDGKVYAQKLLHGVDHETLYDPFNAQPVYVYDGEDVSRWMKGAAS